MKRFLPIVLVTLIFASVSVLLFNLPGKSPQANENRPDRMDLAMEQEFMLTRDMSLNRIPKERLLIASEFKEEKLSQQSGLYTAVSGINWQERGPSNVGGRARAVWFDVNDAPLYRKVWAAGVSGGLWSTNDITIATPVWTKVGDFIDNLAVSSFAQDATTPQTMYFGTGEGWFNVDAGRGLGIWKSLNGGTTWAQLGSTNIASFYYVQKLVIGNAGAVFACTGTAGLHVHSMEVPVGQKFWVRVQMVE